jgi:Ca2+:H+ antiporter
VIFAPIALGLNVVHNDNLLVFLFAAIALVPLAKLISDSTEHLAAYYGPTVGSLLNVTFGNAAEIIIGVIAISAGLIDLVKASITGSILGNILLVFGLSLVAGGLKSKEQSFNKENSGIQSSMLFLAIIGLAVPTVLSSTVLKTVNIENQSKIQILSDILALLLLAVYILGIIFTFVTHKHLFALSKKEEEEEQLLSWTKKRSFLMLIISMVGVIIVSEVLVDSVEVTIKKFGFGELFVGAIVVGIVGNAAEHSGAIILARRGKIDLSIGIAAGSGTQVALFVVPTLVVSGILMGRSFTLVFTIFELIAVFLAAIILNLIVHDGKSNWFEGVMLTVVYIIIAIGFFFIR